MTVSQPRKAPLTSGATHGDVGTNAARLSVVGASLLCLTLIAYLPALKAGFVFDDDTYLTRNPAVQTAGGLGDIWFKPSASPQYYPLTFTSFWVEYRLWGLDPAGYHMVNVLLHAANAILLYVLLRGLGIPVAWLAASIFAVHPVAVESVAWIVERKNVLSAFFWLAAALSYLRFAGVIGAHASRQWALYGLALACLVLSLLAKSATATWPAAMLVVLWWKRGRLTLRDVTPLLPAFFIAVASGLATTWIEKNQVGAEGPEFAWTLVGSWLIAGRAIWFYVWRLLWPFGMCFVYPRWDVDPSQAWQHLFPAAVVAVLALLWLLRKRIGRGPLAAALLFVGTLTPALGFVKVYAMRYSFVADHWVYHTSPIFIMAVAAACSRWVARLRWESRVRFGVAVAVVVFLAILTYRQSTCYRDIETFWRATLDCNGNAWMAHNNLGLQLLGGRRFAEAEEHFVQTIKLKPDHFVALTNLGVAVFAQGRFDEAMTHYRAALAVKPDYALARNHLGVTYFQKRDFAAAAEELRQAVSQNPDNEPARRHLGMVLEQQGEFKAAIEQYEAALKLQPNNDIVANNLAWLLAAAPDDSLRDGRRAVELAELACRLTGWAQCELLGTLSAAYAEVGRFEQAIALARRAERIATESQRTLFLEQLRANMKLYENQQPVRIMPPVTSRPATAPASAAGL